MPKKKDKTKSSAHGGDSGSLSEDQTGRNGKRSGQFPNARQAKFLAVEKTGVPALASGQEEEESGERKVPAPTAGGSEGKEKNSNLIPPFVERNAPSALALGKSVKEGDGAELPLPRPKIPPGSEELGSPTMPKLGREKSPPPPPPPGTPFPPGFDAASFLQWVSSSLGLPQASSSSRQPRDVDGAVASTSRAGVVGSGRKHPGSEVEECSEEGEIAISDSEESDEGTSNSLSFDNPYDKKGKESELPEQVATFLSEVFTHKLTYAEFKERKEAFPTPPSVELALRAPILDPVVANMIKHDTVNTDKNFSDCQDKMLMAANPLVELLAAVKGSDHPLNPNAVCKAIESSLVFLGSASSTMTQYRRELCGRDMKQDMKHVFKTDLPTGSSKYLFGDTFLEKVNTADQARRTLIRGYRIEWESTPVQFVQPVTNISGEDRAKVVDEEVHSMLEKDDLLIIARSREQCLEHIAIARELLEQLGFVLNLEKSQLIPSQVATFLGLVLDSRTLTIYLPEDKLDKVVSSCQSLLEQEVIGTRQLASVVGLLESTKQAILPGPLHFRALQQLLNFGIKKPGKFDSSVSLTPDAVKDLQWWISHVREVNGRRVFVPSDLTICTDASLEGWGAHCNGQETGGRWSQTEARMHINWLELKAAFLALRSFVSADTQHVLLRLDNTTAVAYVNHMGGTRSPDLAALALEMWSWALERGLMLSATHVPGLTNTLADRCSRVFLDKVEWQLNRSVFLSLNNWTGNALTVDLFASRLNAQLEEYVSWHPEPEAMAVDALNIHWGNLGLAYAFPPFSLVFKVLRKVQSDVATVILIAPVWKSQAWYPKVLNMLFESPVLLPQSWDLLFLPHNRRPHPLLPDLMLAAWPISGDSCRVGAFRQGLQISSSRLGEKVLLDSISQHGLSGPAGVIEGRLIQFAAL
ncbi:hypothetical protein Bbelb_030170 [Branchiostoma belcheri]|nr:hypothetical protein Bbelb_030170 [Branchiostoma belcheri]